MNSECLFTLVSIFNVLITKTHFFASLSYGKEGKIISNFTSNHNLPIRWDSSNHVFTKSRCKLGIFSNSYEGLRWVCKKKRKTSIHLSWQKHVWKNECRNFLVFFFFFSSHAGLSSRLASGHVPEQPVSGTHLPRLPQCYLPCKLLWQMPSNLLRREQRRTRRM